MKKTKFHLPVLGIIINDKRQVLLIQRYNPKNRYSHLKWAFPGGGIEFGEHPNETLIREVREEVGVEIDPVEDALFVENHVFEKNFVHVLCLCYPAHFKSGKIDTSKDDSTKDAKWFNIEEINYSKCLPKTKDILEKALKHL